MDASLTPCSIKLMSDLNLIMGAKLNDGQPSTATSVNVPGLEPL